MIGIYLILWFCFLLMLIYGAVIFESSKGIVSSIVIGVFLLIPIGLSIPIRATQNGEHTGYITAIQSSGVIWKNNYVFVKTDNSSSQEDTYCIPRDNAELVDRLREVSKTRDLVTVKYDTVYHFLYSWGKCDGDIITNFEMREE